MSVRKKGIHNTKHKYLENISTGPQDIREKLSIVSGQNVLEYKQLSWGISFTSDRLMPSSKICST